jgi:hypothetical protein
MCQLQDDIKDIAKQRKGVNTDMRELQTDVMQYMLQNNVSKCNYHEDEIFVNKRTAAGSLSRGSLRNALEEYFGSDDSETCASCYEFVIESLGTKEVTELKRRKRKAPKATKKKITANAMDEDDSDN